MKFQNLSTHGHIILDTVHLKASIPLDKPNQNRYVILSAKHSCNDCFMNLMNHISCQVNFSHLNYEMIHVGSRWLLSNGNDILALRLSKNWPIGRYSPLLKGGTLEKPVTELEEYSHDKPCQVYWSAHLMPRSSNF